MKRLTALFSPLNILVPVGILFLLGSNMAYGQCAVVDQSQTDGLPYDTGFIDYQTSFWQSFTAGLSGSLISVEFQVSSGGSSSLTRFRIYAGEGTGGTVLYTTNTTTLVSGWKSVDLPGSGIPSQAGSTYTIEFYNSSGTSGLIEDYNHNGSRKMNGSGQFVLRFVTHVESSTISPGSISFGTVPVGSSVTDTVTIQNPGCSSLSVSSIDINNNQYSVSPAANTLTGDIQKYAVTFAPTISGIQNGTISFTLNSSVTLSVQASGNAISAEPTLQSSSPSFSNVASNAMTVQWAKGNGEKRIILMRLGSLVDASPSDQVSYTANSIFGSGAQVGNGNYVVYGDTGSSVTVTGLYPAMTYYVSVFEFNGQGGGENYLVSSPATGSQTLPVGAPSVSVGTFVSGTGSTESLQATVNTNGGRTAAHFLYGLTSGYGSTTSSDTIEDPIPVISFNGTDQYAVTSGYSSSLALTTAGTVETWIKPLPPSDYEEVIAVGGAAGNGIEILVTNGGALRVNSYLGNWIGTTSTGVNVLDGFWHHVAAVVNGASLKVYVDGVLRASASGFDNLNTGDAYITLGKHPSNIYFYKGSMDEIRIWNAALSQDTILAWMGGPVNSSHPNFSNLKSYWRIDEQSGGVLYDSSGNSNNGTLANSPLWSTTPKPAATPIASTATGLQPSTTYHFAVVATNSGGSTTGADAQFVSEPTIDASSFTVALHSLTSSTLQWVNGNGTHRIVIARQGNLTNGLPIDGISLSAFSTIGGGSLVGTGTYVVYDDTGSTVTVHGLQPGVRYYFALFEAAGSGSLVNYKTSNPSLCSDSISAIPSRPGFAMRFDGIDDFIKIVDPTPMTNYTVEFWVKPADVRSEAIIYRLSSTASNDQGTNLSEEAYIDSTGKAHHFSTKQAASFTANSTAAAFIPGQWYHIAIALDGIRTYVYVNGNATQPVSSGLYWQGGGDYYVGLRDSLFGHLNKNFFGEIDELRFWSVTRTVTQIRNAMHQTLTGTETGLLGYYQFGEGVGTIAGDPVRGLSGTMSGFNFDSTSGWVPSTAPVGGAGAFVNTTMPTSVGTAGAQAQVSITTTPSTANNLGLYQYGTTTGLITTETFPSGIDRRSDCLWGILKRGTVTADVALSFSAINTITNANDARVIYRADAVSPWSDVTAEFIPDTNAHTFTKSGETVFGEYSIGAAAALLPVELVSFTATSNRLNAELQWKTATEVNNYGFEIEKRGIQNSVVSSQKENTQWTKSGFVAGAGTANAPRFYAFTERNVYATTYEYRLKQIDRDGKFKYSQSIKVEVGVAPRVLELSQNYPNPFNPTTNIEFTVPTNGRATLKLFNMLGQEVATLFNEQAEAGKYHQITFNGTGLASGTYISRLVFEGKIQVKKMMLVK